MDWCVANEFKLANHKPSAVLNGDTPKQVWELQAQPGTTVHLSAAGSHDPDGDSIEATWWVYREAGTFDDEVALASQRGETTSLQLPQAARPGRTFHVIFQLRDNGNPALFAYRRAIVTVQNP